jgi:hypothetical protein
MLLGTVVELALDPAPVGIGGEDEPLAGRPQFFDLEMRPSLQQTTSSARREGKLSVIASAASSDRAPGRSGGQPPDALACWRRSPVLAAVLASSQEESNERKGAGEMRRHEILKRLAGLIAVFMLAAGITAVFALAPASQAGNSPRSGALHVTKECSEYNGAVGEFCTITSSNIPAIEPGMKVVYLATPAGGALDADLALGFGQGTALGHVVLDLSTGSGRVTFSTGTGRFGRFRADVAVSVDQAGVWHWDGRYRFGRSDDDGDD